MLSASSINNRKAELDTTRYTVFTVELKMLQEIEN